MSKVCLSCALLKCDDTASACKYRIVQLTRTRSYSRRKRMNKKLKADIIAILEKIRDIEMPKIAKSKYDADRYQAKKQQEIL